MKCKRLTNYFKLFAVVLSTILAAVFPGVFITAAQPPVISVSVPTQIINPGQQFSVDIMIQPNNPTAGAQFNLFFNPELVTAEAVSEGGFLKQHGAETFFYPGQIDNGNGTISSVAGVITDSTQTVSSSGTLAIITMTANQSIGKCSFNLSKVIVSDGSAQTIPISVSNGQVEISNSIKAVGGTGGSAVVKNDTAGGQSPTLSATSQSLNPLLPNDSSVSPDQSMSLTVEASISTPSIDTSDSLLIGGQDTTQSLDTLSLPTDNPVDSLHEASTQNSRAIKFKYVLFLEVFVGTLLISGIISGLMLFRLRRQQSKTL